MELYLFLKIKIKRRNLWLESQIQAHNVRCAELNAHSRPWYKGLNSFATFPPQLQLRALQPDRKMYCIIFNIINITHNISSHLNVHKNPCAVKWKQQPLILLFFFLKQTRVVRLTPLTNNKKIGNKKNSCRGLHDKWISTWMATCNFEKMWPSSQGTESD